MTVYHAWKRTQAWGKREGRFQNRQQQTCKDGSRRNIYFWKSPIPSCSQAVKISVCSHSQSLWWGTVRKLKIGQTKPQNIATNNINNNKMIWSKNLKKEFSDSLCVWIFIKSGLKAAENKGWRIRETIFIIRSNVLNKNTADAI